MLSGTKATVRSDADPKQEKENEKGIEGIPLIVRERVNEMEERGMKME